MISIISWFYKIFISFFYMTIKDRIHLRVCSCVFNYTTLITICKVYSSALFQTNWSVEISDLTEEKRAGFTYQFISRKFYSDDSRETWKYFSFSFITSSTRDKGGKENSFIRFLFFDPFFNVDASMNARREWYLYIRIDGKKKQRSSMILLDDSLYYIFHQCQRS